MILVVITTCNQLEYTKLTIDSLKRTTEKFDVLVIDDFSRDDTISYLENEEFCGNIIVKKEPRGLTNSWNTAYDYFKKSTYEFLFLLNNDILVPDGAITNMVEVLEKEVDAVVSPLCNIYGVKRNPMQSVGAWYDEVTEEYENDPNNYQEIQDRMNQVEYGGKKKIYIDAATLEPSNINGFVLGFNRSIEKCEFSETELFDPKNINIGNEVELATRLKRENFSELICAKSFVFHYKGITLGETDRNNLNKIHGIPEEKIFSQPDTSELKINNLSIREFLKDT